MQEKILIVGPSWIGDMVMAQCLFQAIKMQSPDATIDVFSPEWTKALVSCMPECDTVIPSDLKHGQLNLSYRYQVAKSLRLKYSRAYILPNSFKSALIPFWAKIPQRIGWRGEWRDWLLTQTLKSPKQYPLMVQRYVALIDDQVGLKSKHDFSPHFVVPSDQKAQAIQKFSHNPSRPMIAICPGAAFGPSKQWLVERFIHIANHYEMLGWQVGLFGSQNDTTIADKIAQNCHNCVNYVGKTNLLEAIALLDEAKLVLTHDSGLMHVACALHKPVVVLYGSSSPKFTPPLSNQSQILQGQVSCSPCFKRTCHQDQHYCMQAISTQAVLDAAQKVLAA